MSRVLLTGFMGCGKSTIGARLATRLSVDFIDLDDRIVNLAGMTVEQIFSQQGEDAFRELESRALRSLPNNVVCALGGGTLVRPANLAWALRESWMVYLRVGLTELVRRLQEDKTVRPLLQDRDGSMLSPIQMEIRVRDLLGQREPIYNQAHQTFDLDGLTPEVAAAKCWEAYRSRNV
ncbi:MAG: shikimate kinase [Rhodothermaceae bacterium]|nr:shikimate kinase [Rhodothermaceae bacterium]MXZ58371.1 shikimate kinase [Rhodothermaceae bacterium]MYB91602.1 shikimate kinase [Rhodothermaceae bacterium]MYD67162.1 shikimate kinase [Rhodothermaceae bacterium]MYG44666.1 shikimate kinase [Rhodothermaceae bacterium]